MTADNQREVRTLRLILQKRPESEEIISILLDNPLPEIPKPELKKPIENVEESDCTDAEDSDQ